MSQFSFNRLQKADPVLGVDMASTGEVGCLGNDTNTALLKSMLSVGHRIPEHTILLSSDGAKQKAELLDAARQLVSNGYKIYATPGSSRYLTAIDLGRAADHQQPPHLRLHQRLLPREIRRHRHQELGGA